VTPADRAGERPGLAASMEDLIEEHSAEGEWDLCDGDFPRFAEVATRGMLDRLGQEFLPYSAFHHELAAIAESCRRAVILAPRSHLKSTIMSQLHPLYVAAYQPKGMVPGQFLIADTNKQAMENLDRIKMLVESNGFLRHLKPSRGAGGGGSSGWTSKKIVLTNGSVIQVSGFGSPIRGWHPHRIVMDDILGDTQRYTFQFIKKFIKRAITPMLRKDGSMLVVGTPQHQSDPLMELTTIKAYRYAHYRAVTDWEKHEVLWPAGWSFEALMQRRAEIGTTAFAQEYQCEPVDDASSMFPWTVLERSFAPNISLQDAATSTFPIYVGVDVARSGRIGADWWVAIAIELDEDGNRTVLSIERERGLSLPEQLERLRSLGKRFDPEAIVVEANAFASFISDEARRLTDLPIRPHTTGTEKAGLEGGVPGLVVLFENGKYRIPRKTDRDKAATDELLHELNHFGWEGATVKGRGANDDCVMALWLAELGMRKPRRRVTSFSLR
jgi:hypothetical protein